jgi:hypothetical protein
MKSNIFNGHGKEATPDNEHSHARSLTPVPPLEEQLANQLSHHKTMAKLLVIPAGEEYGSSLREFHVNGECHD